MSTGGGMSNPTLDEAQIERWASYLLAAADERRAVSPITDEQALSYADAYAIQDRLLEKRLERGERLIGAKLGLTSRAKQKQMNVEEPVYGWLTDVMLLPNEEPFARTSLIHPRAEPELVFYVGERLAGARVTAQEVLRATEAVGGGIEIIDSRYENFRFTLPDVVADNTSAARFTLGTSRIAPESRDLCLLGCVFERNGEIEATATGAASMGNPAEAVAMLVRHLARRPEGGPLPRALEEGFVVLAGGLTGAVFLEPGTHVSASYPELGAVRVRVAREAEGAES